MIAGIGKERWRTEKIVADLLDHLWNADNSWRSLLAYPSLHSWFLRSQIFNICLDVLPSC